jgi:hypothetical protein
MDLIDEKNETDFLTIVKRIFSNILIMMVNLGEITNIIIRHL